MTDFERERLGRYIEDAGRYMAGVAKILDYPETPSEVAILSLARAGMEIAAGMQRQYGLPVCRVYEREEDYRETNSSMKGATQS